MNDKKNNKKWGHGKPSVLCTVDFFLNLYQEKIEGSGEDSFACYASDRAVLFGVFDGCGGAGAQRYLAFQGKSGAFMASRAAAAAAGDWFQNNPHAEQSGADMAISIQSCFEKNLEVLMKYSRDESRLKGRLNQKFPTTAAVGVLTGKKEAFSLSCLWAGDSRCYLLDSGGLAQLTADDLNSYDPMENLTGDGVLTNVISASRKFTVHAADYSVAIPCIVFAATDGCFAYLSTPMEFEFLMLDTMLRADTPAQWEMYLTDFLKETAGDDFTLCGTALGFGNFSAMQEFYLPRYRVLKDSFIDKIETLDRQEKYELWKPYSENYLRFLQKKKGDY